MKKLKNLLEKSQANRILSQGDMEKISRAVDIVNGYCEGKSKLVGKEHFLKGNGRGKVKEALNCLLVVTMREPVTPLLKDMVEEFLKFISNWNEESFKDVEIKELSLTVRRFLRYHLSVIETTKIIKGLLKRIDKIQKFSPLVFRLSQNYLKSLDQRQPKRLGKQDKK